MKTMLTIIQKILGGNTPQDKIDHQPHCSDHDDINVSQCLLKLLKEKASHQSTHLTLQEDTDRLERVNQLLDQHEMDVNVEDNGCSLIIHAIQNQHANEAIAILQHAKGQWVRLDYQDQQERNTPLIWAMKCHQWDVVAQILQLPSSLDSHAHETWSWADGARSDDQLVSGGALSNPLQKGLESQESTQGNECSQHWMGHVWGQKDGQHQSWINRVNNYDETALLYACYLLTASHDWVKHDKDSGSVVDLNESAMRTTKKEQIDLIKRIINHADFRFAENNQGQKALEIAIGMNREDVVAILLEAAMVKNWQWASLVKSTHADANALLIKSLKLSCTGITKMLTVMGEKFKLSYNISAGDDLGQNLLHHVVKAGDIDVLEYLYTKTPQGTWTSALNKSDHHGTSIVLKPINYAIMQKRIPFNVVEFLLDKGAKINQRCFTRLLDEANERNNREFAAKLLTVSKSVIQQPAHGMMGHILSEKSLLSEYQWTLSAIAVIFAIASAISANQRNVEGGSHLTPS